VGTSHANGACIHSIALISTGASCQPCPRHYIKLAHSSTVMATAVVYLH